MIENLDKKIKSEITGEEEQKVYGYQCRKTKFELEKLLHQQFDINKKARHSQGKSTNEDEHNWMIELEQFLNHKQRINFMEHLPTTIESDTSSNSEESIISIPEKVIPELEKNKAGIV